MVKIARMAPRPQMPIMTADHNGPISTIVNNGAIVNFHVTVNRSFLFFFIVQHELTLGDNEKTVMMG
jgi:hypothetical protein